MARLAHENRVMVAHAHGGGTTVVLPLSLCHVGTRLSEQRHGGALP